MVLSGSDDIWFNLALEQYLIMTSKTDQLFLWSNSPSVIVGRNQDVYSECNLSEIQKDSVKLARRKSGGGTVYHDKGNLCFTIIRPYVSDPEKQKKDNFDFILSCLSKAGRQCSLSGRNDIVYNSAKVSGSAFQYDRNVFCHHGTILLDCDFQKMCKYITPDRYKLDKHYVSSVNSRVCNLNINKEKLVDIMFSDFGNSSCSSVQISPELINRLYSKMSDYSWIYGRKRVFTHKYTVVDESGTFNYMFDVKDNRILDFEVYSDSLDTLYTENEFIRISRIIGENQKSNSESSSSSSSSV